MLKTNTAGGHIGLLLQFSDIYGFDPEIVSSKHQGQTHRTLTLHGTNESQDIMTLDAQLNGDGTVRAIQGRNLSPHVAKYLQEQVLPHMSECQYTVEGQPPILPTQVRAFADAFNLTIETAPQRHLDTGYVPAGAHMLDIAHHKLTFRDYQTTILAHGCMSTGGTFTRLELYNPPPEMAHYVRNVLRPQDPMCQITGDDLAKYDEERDFKSDLGVQTYMAVPLLLGYRVTVNQTVSALVPKYVIQAVKGDNTITAEFSHTRLDALTVKAPQSHINALQEFVKRGKRSVPITTEVTSAPVPETYSKAPPAGPDTSPQAISGVVDIMRTPDFVKGEDIIARYAAKSCMTLTVTGKLHVTMTPVAHPAVTLLYSKHDCQRLSPYLSSVLDQELSHARLPSGLNR